MHSQHILSIFSALSLAIIPSYPLLRHCLGCRNDAFLHISTTVLCTAYCAEKTGKHVFLLTLCFFKPHTDCCLLTDMTITEKPPLFLSSGNVLWGHLNSFNAQCGEWSGACGGDWQRFCGPFHSAPSLFIQTVKLLDSWPMFGGHELVWNDWRFDGVWG